MHCKHILVGCCHDNGYVPFLEAFNSDEMTSRISLIRHCGMGREYRRLRFNIASLEGLFRETNLPLHVEARLSNLKRTKTPSPEIDRRGSIWSTRVPIEPQGSYGGKGNRYDFWDSDKHYTKLSDMLGRTLEAFIFYSSTKKDNA